MNKEEYRKKIGRELRIIRIELNMDRTQFAKLFNSKDPKDLTTNEASIGRYERGEVTIPGDKLEKFKWLKYTGEKK